MTVSNVEATAIRIGDGVATVFDFDIEAIDAASILVGYIVGTSVVLANPLDYSVSMNVGLTGGTVTFLVAPVNGTKIYIYRETTQTQVVSVSRQQSYDPSVVERVWDKLTFLIQELSAKVNRSVKTGPDSNPDTLIADINTARDTAVASAAAAVSDAAAAEASAISAAASAASADFFTFGLGITANATLLADIDSTTIAAGTYRYDATTAGTFPAGVVKADGGLVIVRRQSATIGVMELFPAPNQSRFSRRLATTWQAWGARGSILATNAQAIAQSGLDNEALMTPQRGLDQILANKTRLAIAPSTPAAAATHLVTGLPLNRECKIVFTGIQNSNVAVSALTIRFSTDGGSTWVSAPIAVSRTHNWNADFIMGEFNIVPALSIFSNLSMIGALAAAGTEAQPFFRPLAAYISVGNFVVQPNVNAFQLGWTANNFMATGSVRVYEV